MKSFSLENEHFDDLVPGTPDYVEYVQGATSTASLVDQAVMIAFEGNVEPDFNSRQEGYFGVTFLKLGAFGARLVVNRTLNDITGLYFDKAHPEYDEDRQSLTIEGIAQAGGFGSPDLALGALSDAVGIARELEELHTPLDTTDEK